MKLFTSAVLAFCLGAVSTFAAETEEDVLVLTDANFDETVSAHDLLLVEFYAPWCGHCKNLAPEYAEAAGTLKDLEEPLFVAKVDATENEVVAKKYGIQGFPTLKLFRGLDSVSDYDGGRTADAIVSYMIKKSGPAAKALTVDEVDEFKASADVVVVGSFADAEGDAYKAFMKVADTGDLPFGVVVGAAEDSVTIYKDGESEGLTEDLTDAAAVKTFIASNRLPLVIPFSQDTARVLFDDEQPIKVNVLVFADEDKKGDVIDTVKASATAHKGQALYVHVDETNDRVFEYFGLSHDDFPTYVVVNMDGGMKKFLPDSSDFEKLQAYVDDYLAGNLKPSLKSDAIPEDPLDEGVYVIVGKSFEDVVLDDSKDVLVEFYAPWCGHCKALAPKYVELAAKFEEVDSVIIAKMDATANEVDHPDVNVQGFPTLKFFPANSDGKVVDYEGAREADAMYDFVVKNAGAEIVEAAEEEEKDEL